MGVGITALFIEAPRYNVLPSLISILNHNEKTHGLNFLKCRLNIRLCHFDFNFVCINLP